MKTIRFIGDCHARFAQYKKIIADAPASIQVGDMGCGFYKWDHHEGRKVMTTNPPYDHMVKHNARFIRGNHDNPEVCKNHTQWIPDGTIEIVNGVKIMYIGGALSVDRIWRTEGYDYWIDEELSQSKLQEFIDLYSVEKPDIMVSHDIPESSAIEMERISGRRKLDINSITRVAFQEMLNRFSPKVWIVGHWHQSNDFIINGTNFICLNELEYLDIELKNGRINKLK